MLRAKTRLGLIYRKRRKRLAI